MIDFAHNPHGMAALGDISRRCAAAGRTLVALGQAGDRDDASIRELARAAHGLGPDHVIVKEMDKYRRGRAPGEVPGLIIDELRRLGMPAEDISTAPDDLGALRQALAWAPLGRPAGWSRSMWISSRHWSCWAALPRARPGPPDRRRGQTTRSFHLPRRNSTQLTAAVIEYAAVIAAEHADRPHAQPHREPPTPTGSRTARSSRG